MTTKAWWKEQHQRTKLLKVARDMARSGNHDNHATIITEIELSENFADARPCLTSGFIPGQLDRLCTLAQAAAKASGDTLSAFLGEMRRAGHRDAPPGPDGLSMSGIRLAR